jgi:hypothetical protein
MTPRWADYGLTEAQAKALAILADLSPTYGTVTASQVAHRLYGSSRSHGRGPGGRPAAAARLLDALTDQGLARRDWSSPIHQAQWTSSTAGLDLAAALNS